MYRLFERARDILNRPNENISKAAKRPTSVPNRTSSHQSKEYVSGIITQHQEEGEASMLLTPETSIPMGEQPEPLWFNESPNFSNVDQLLSPGFSLSENVLFQGFFMDYDNVEGYDPMPSILNEAPAGLPYDV
jgi:hypothetical protein